MIVICERLNLAEMPAAVFLRRAGGSTERRAWRMMMLEPARKVTVAIRTIRVVNPAVMERFSIQFSPIRFVQRHLFRISRCWMLNAERGGVWTAEGKIDCYVNLMTISINACHRLSVLCFLVTILCGVLRAADETGLLLATRFNAVSRQFDMVRWAIIEMLLCQQWVYNQSATPVGLIRLILRMWLIYLLIRPFEGKIDCFPLD